MLRYRNVFLSAAVVLGYAVAAVLP